MRKCFWFIFLFTFYFLFSQTEYDPMPSRNPDPTKYPAKSFNLYRNENQIQPGIFKTIKSSSNRNNAFLAVFADELIIPLLPMIEQYFYDLQADGFSPIIIGYSGNSAEQLRQEISSYYENANIIGVALIGDLPSCWFEMFEDWNNNGVQDDDEDIVSFPCELYFSDLDGNWQDSDNDGILDVHNGNMQPEIMIGRIKADNLTNTDFSEEELLTLYFQRNHLYRTNQLESTDNALLYIDDDWQNYSGNYHSYLSTLYNDIVNVHHAEETTAEDYRDNQLQIDYEFIQLHAHSGPQLHGFYYNNHTENGWVTSEELATINPRCWFYNLFCCSATHFETENNLAGTYLLNNNFALAVIGSSKAGGMLYFADFYNPLAMDKTLGEALQQWWIAHVDINEDQQYQRTWFYGMMIIGDPTLQLYRESATTWYVDTTNPEIGDGSFDNPFRNIQPGIDTAENGDQIIIADGVYQESINFLGKSIKVSSLNGAENCIIDGQNEVTCVVFENDEPITTCLESITLINGDGGYTPATSGGGIRCFNDADPTLKNIVIKQCDKGIYMGDSSPTLFNCLIEGNSNYGIHMEYGSQPIIRNCIIRDNDRSGIYNYDTYFRMYGGEIAFNRSSSNGGGISLLQGSCYLEDVSIHNNTAPSGGGIYIYWSNIVFSEENRCSIYDNRASLGMDLYRTNNNAGNISVVLDTFTVIQPTEHYAYPLEYFTFDIQSGYTTQVDSDLYVSPTGSDDNDGLTPSTPLKTIYKASNIILAGPDNPHTIFLGEGVYSQQSNDEIFPIYLCSHISLVGNSQRSTIIKADTLSTLLYLSNNNGNKIENLTLQRARNAVVGIQSDLELENLNISQCVNHGLYFSSSSVTMTDIHIHNNSGQLGAGIMISSNSNVDMIDCIVEENNAEIGGGIYLRYNANLNLQGGKIRNNQASEKGGGICSQNANVSFDSEERVSIYLNNSLQGRDLYFSFQEERVEVFADTFTVKIPTNVFSYPVSIFQFYINTALLDQTDSDLFVSPIGDDTNDGLSPDSPFKTIRHAQACLLPSAENQTIYLASGIYSPTSNGDIFPFYNFDRLNLSGDISGESILESENTTLFIIQANTTSLSKLTLRNCTTAIICETASLELDNMKIENCLSEDRGGAIFLEQATLAATEIQFINNKSWTSGGAIFAEDSNVTLNYCTFEANEAQALGGAIYLEDCTSTLIGNSISNNSALYGGGIYTKYGSPTFSSFLLNSIYLNSAGKGGDLYLRSSNLEVVLLDTFSIDIPGKFHFYSTQETDLSFQNYIYNQISGSLWVSPNGDNSNSGTSSDAPLKTIYSALCRLDDTVATPNFVHLMPGEYSPAVNQEKFPLGMISNTFLQGSDIEQTIINPNHQNRAICIIDCDNFKLSDMKILDGESRYSTISSGYNGKGGGIFAYNSTFDIINVWLKDCTAQNGSAIYQNNCTSNTINTLFTGNEVEDFGTISSYSTLATFINCTITDNEGDFCGLFLYDADIYLMNCVLYDPEKYLVYISDSMHPSYFISINSNLEYSNYTIECISADPLFENPGNGNYSLSENSPCLGSGTISYSINGLNLIAPEYDLFGNLRPNPTGSNPDMGTFEHELGEPLNPIDPNEIIALTRLLGNYPNPFNPTTKIRFNISPRDAQNVAIIIYNVKGQIVKSIAVTFSDSSSMNRIEGQQENTTQSVSWDGRGSSGKPVASGVYLYTLKVENRIIDAKKMLLLK